MYLDTLQLNSNTLFVFDGAVLSLGKLVRQSHIFQLQMLNHTKLSHLSSLREGKNILSALYLTKSDIDFKKKKTKLMRELYLHASHLTL